jgi:hypothetical protein
MKQGLVHEVAEKDECGQQEQGKIPGETDTGKQQEVQVARRRRSGCALSGFVSRTTGGAEATIDGWNVQMVWKMDFGAQERPQTESLLQGVPRRLQS